MNKKENIIILLGSGMIILLLILLSSGEVKQVKEPVSEKKMTQIEIEVITEKQLTRENAPPTAMPESENDNEKNDKPVANGGLPPLHANYREHIGFAKYAQEMRVRGARFFVTGGNNRQLLEIDFATRNLIPVDIKNIVGHQFSPRTRIISDEPALDKYIKLAKEEYSIELPEQILLVPQAMESIIAANIAKVLPQKHKGFKGISGIRGFYHTKNGQFCLKITEAVTSHGIEKININIGL